MESNFHGRVAKKNPDSGYTPISNFLIRDQRITAEGRILIAWAATHTDTFVWSRKTAMNAIGVKSLTTFYKVLNNLKEFGYCSSFDEVNYIMGKPGFTSCNYIFYEYPSESEEWELAYGPSVPKNGTPSVPKNGTSSVPKNGTHKKEHFLEEQIENIKGKQKLVEEPQTTPMSETGTGEQPKCLVDKLFMPRSQESKNEESVTAEIIGFLNDLTGLGYKPKTKSTILLVKRRMADGFTLEEMKLAVEDRVKNWINDPKMKPYLRPETLFGNKFEGYLQAAKLNEPKIINKPTEETEW